MSNDDSIIALHEYRIEVLEKKLDSLIGRVEVKLDSLVEQMAASSTHQAVQGSTVTSLVGADKEAIRRIEALENNVTNVRLSIASIVGYSSLTVGLLEAIITGIKYLAGA